MKLFVTPSAAGLLYIASALLQTVSGHGFVQDISVSSSSVPTKWYTGSLPFTDSWASPPPARIVWPFYQNGNGPVTDVSSSDIVCNKLSPISSGQLATADGIKGGDSLTFFWTNWPTGHQGPVLTYLARCTDSAGADVSCDAVQDPSSLSFFKIDEAGYDKAARVWASDKLIANNNSWTVAVPNDIAPGDYIVRHEILALQEAMVERAAQFYPLCANIRIASSEGTKRPQGVKFPGAYQATDPGVLVNIYGGESVKENYVIPGPALYGVGGSTPASTLSSASILTSASTSTLSLTSTSTSTSIPDSDPTSSSTSTPFSFPTQTTFSFHISSLSSSSSSFFSTSSIYVTLTKTSTTQSSGAPATADADVTTTETAEKPFFSSLSESATGSPTLTASPSLETTSSSFVTSSLESSSFITSSETTTIYPINPGSGSTISASPISASGTGSGEPVSTKPTASSTPVSNETTPTSDPVSTKPTPTNEPASTEPSSIKPTPITDPVSNEPTSTSTPVPNETTTSQPVSTEPPSPNEPTDSDVDYEHIIVTASPVLARVTKTIYETTVVIQTSV